MDTLIIFCTLGLALGSLYWFVFILGAAHHKGKRAVDLSGGLEKIQDDYNKYWSFFRCPKEIKDVDQVPHFVNTFYNLVTDLYEWGWGQSFHSSPPIPGKSHAQATRQHELMAGDLIKISPAQNILDVGCGVGGPMRTIASHSQANIVGITMNGCHVERARKYNKKAGLDSLCEVVRGNFLEMPFQPNTFDGAYSIDATCHAPKLEDVYSEVIRVLKPGALYVSYEWVTTDKYNNDNPEHREVIEMIERGDALPGLRSYKGIATAARAVGFEVVKELDLAMPPSQPWWIPLKSGLYDYRRTNVIVTVLAAIGVVPKGTIDVAKMLCKTIENIRRGGEMGIFTPMHMILCRKPLDTDVAPHL